MIKTFENFNSFDSPDLEDIFRELELNFDLHLESYGSSDHSDLPRLYIDLNFESPSQIKEIFELLPDYIEKSENMLNLKFDYMRVCYNDGSYIFKRDTNNLSLDLKEEVRPVPTNQHLRPKVVRKYEDVLFITILFMALKTF